MSDFGTSWGMPIDPQRQADLHRIAAERSQTAEPTADQIKAYLEQESISAGQQLEEERTNQACLDWMEATPEFKPTPRNGAQMQEYLVARNLPASSDNLQQAFEYLRDRNFITHNTAEVKQAVKKEIAQDYAARRAHSIMAEKALSTVASREEMYNMSMEDLKFAAETGRRRR